MKIFGNKKNLGNKAKNLVILKENKINIPDTIIIEFNESKIDFLYLEKKLDKKSKYILRPSFDIEDGDNKSYAGFFNSLFPLDKNEIIIALKDQNIKNKFNGNSYKLKSIIIQDFVEAEHYGVYFSRDPNNILKKGFYEIGKSNNEITSGKNVETSNKLNFINKIELELIGKNLEHKFKFPQDIEFCIKDGKIILLQTRAITTGNNTNYNFEEIMNINGVYKTLDFDELGDFQDYFSFEVLNRLFKTIYIGNKIYFKNYIIPVFIFKDIKVDNKNLDIFYKTYKKYLLKKIIFSIIKFFSNQKFDKKTLEIFFQKYKYSFILNKKSFLDLKFNNKTNFITKKLLEVEKVKNSSFKHLEKYKEEYIEKENNHIIIKDSELSEKLIIKNGIILNKVDIKEEFKWIYKGKLSGILTDNKSFKYEKNLNQILISENIDLDLYEKIDYLSGVIIKNGNSLSHNSILLREYKLPSIIKYIDYNKLITGEKIKIKDYT